MNRYVAALVGSLVAASVGWALDFQFERQKLKLSYEYENFVSINGSQILTPGLKATYLAKGGAAAGQRLLLNFDVQTGLKGNVQNGFRAGDLSRFTWTNRVATSAIVPWKQFYVGSSFYVRSKWLSDVRPELRFVDIFSGEGYHELTGGLTMGYLPSPKWEIAGSVQKSALSYQHFTLSNSRSSGASLRVSRKINEFKLGAAYRYRNIDYDRPVIAPRFGTMSTTDLQHDNFWELGGNIEFVRFFYFSSGYYYQRNHSNSANFSFSNHRISVLIGTDLRQDLHLQAYGVLSRQDYFAEQSPLDVPLFVDESENTMAASLIKTLNDRSEIELGFQRYANNSSFRVLNASKNVLYAAYNFRF